MTEEYAPYAPYARTDVNDIPGSAHKRRSVLRSDAAGRRAGQPGAASGQCDGRGANKKLIRKSSAPRPVPVGTGFPRRPEKKGKLRGGLMDCSNAGGRPPAATTVGRRPLLAGLPGKTLRAPNAPSDWTLRTVRALC